VPALDDVRVIDAEHFLAVRHIRCDDAYLEGHYPGFPLYPGVFLVESACVAARSIYGMAWLTSVESVRFQAPLRPGDELHLYVSVQENDGTTLALKVLATQAGGQQIARMALRLRRQGGQR
jgi:3-hydroxyacyl-[acyl-carrier-protein] dehydratase